MSPQNPNQKNITEVRINSAKVPREGYNLTTIQVLIVALLALGFGFAAGNNFSPTRTNSGAQETLATAAAPTTSSRSGSTLVTIHPATASPSSRPIATLESLTEESGSDFYSLQHGKDVLAYAENLSPSEIGGALHKIEKMTDDLAKLQIS
jgi:hypothetical protein